MAYLNFKEFFCTTLQNRGVSSDLSDLLWKTVIPYKEETSWPKSYRYWKRSKCPELTKDNCWVPWKNYWIKNKKPTEDYKKLIEDLEIAVYATKIYYQNWHLDENLPNEETVPAPKQQSPERQLKFIN